MSASITPLHGRHSLTNQEAEQELLGSILRSNKVLDQIGPMRLEQFAVGVHGRIYEAILRMLSAGSVATPVTLKALFERDGELAHVGGNAYLAKLAMSSNGLMSAKACADLIRGLAARRCAMSLMEEMGAATQDLETPFAQTLDTFQGMLDELASGSVEGRKPRPIGEAAIALVQELQDARASGKTLLGITTGLASLDRTIGGLRPGEIIVIAGRPAMGKTTIGQSIASAAARSGAGVAFWSMEEHRKAFAGRVLSDPTGVPYSNIRNGEIDDHSLQRLVEAALDLGKVPLWVQDIGGMTVEAIRSDARRIKREMAKQGVKLGLLVIDYLQLMRTSHRQRNDGRTQEVTDISNGMKALALDLDVPVLVLSQLNRGVESRDDKRPRLSDLRDSGAIEQDADVVIFVYREQYYLERNEPNGDGPALADWHAKMADAHNKCDLIVAKHRQGEVKVLHTFFDPAIARVRDLDRRDLEERGLL